jgi:tetratricopeptide (TPR) repeat protein
VRMMQPVRMMKLVRCAAVAAALGAVVLPMHGCKNRQRKDAAYQPGPNRIGDAVRLSGEAERAMQRGKKDEAIALYRQAIEASPDLAPAWHNLGVLLMEQKNYIDAVEAFKAAADLAPVDPRPYYMAGLAYHQQGWDEGALSYFVRALERNPNDVLSLRGAVRASKRLDRADRASLDRARRALALDPDDTWRKIEQREALRIEGAMKQSQTRIQLGEPPRVGASAAQPHEGEAQPAPSEEQPPR